jgi:hypothetical protein
MTTNVVIPGMIRLSMFLDQNASGRSGSGTSRSADLVIPFRLWKVGYVLRTETNPEEWTIKNIEAAPDHTMRREDCMVTLINVAREMRVVKGATLSSSYKLVGVGDATPPEAEERADVKPFAVAVAGIREFYPRKHGNEGTRVIMHDKTAYIVLESFDTIWGMITVAGMPAHLAQLEQAGPHS